MSNGERWPAASAYVAAVQHPQSAFSDPQLQQAQIREGLLGLPASASGQNAIVFPAKSTTGEIAIRCFTTPARSGRERYDALSAYLALRPCEAMTKARWLDDGIRVNGTTWPIVEMDWAPGIPLSQAVEQARSEPTRLIALAETWREAMRELHDKRIAHSDLQHGNVLVDDNARLRLVDFDGVWIPPAAELTPREVGHPNYQHPERIETGAWGEHIDVFSALVIYLSLLALAADPTLWDVHNGENIILTANDYKNPGATDIWKRLAQSPDPDVAQLGDLLAGLCRTTVNINTNLEQLLDTHQIPDAPTYQPLAAENTNTWWHHPEQRPVPRSEPTHVAAAAQAPATPPGPAPSRARWGIVAAITLLVLAVLGGGIVALIAGNGDTARQGSSAAPTTNATPPTGQPPTTQAQSTTRTAPASTSVLASNLLVAVPGFTGEDVAPAVQQATRAAISSDLSARGQDVIAVRTFRRPGTSEPTALTYVVGTQGTTLVRPVAGTCLSANSTVSGQQVCAQQQADGRLLLTWGNGAFYVRVLSPDSQLATDVLGAIIQSLQ